MYMYSKINDYRACDKTCCHFKNFLAMGREIGYDRRVHADVSLITGGLQSEPN